MNAKGFIKLDHKNYLKGADTKNIQEQNSRLFIAIHVEIHPMAISLLMHTHETNIDVKPYYEE